MASQSATAIDMKSIESQINGEPFFVDPADVDPEYVDFEYVDPALTPFDSGSD